MNQEELTKMEKLEERMLPYFRRNDIPPPKSEEIEKTILQLRQLMPMTPQEEIPIPKTPLNGILAQAWLELKLSPIYLLLSQIAFLMVGLGFMMGTNHYVLVAKYIFVAAPLIWLIQLWLGVKDRSGSMAELEMTLRYGAEQLFFARFLMSSIVHTGVMILFLSITTMYFQIGSIILFMLWLVPSFVIAALFLLLSFKLPRTWYGGQTLMVLWGSFSVFFLLGFNEEMFIKWMGLPTLLHGILLVGSILFFLMAIRITRKELSHAFECTVTE